MIINFAENGNDILLSDFVNMYLKTDTDSNDFTVNKIIMSEPLKNFKSMTPDITIFEYSKTETLKEKNELGLNLAFQYLIEKLILEYSGNKLISLEENISFNNEIDSGLFVNIIDDYITWLKNNISLNIGINNIETEFLFNLKNKMFLTKLFNYLNKYLINIVMNMGIKSPFLYPLKWDIWSDGVAEFYYAVTGYGSKSFYLLDIKKLWDIDFKLQNNRRLLC